MDGEFKLIGILRIKDQNGEWQEIQAIKGDKGDKGADGTMTFEDLTEEQRESLKGDPFTFEDFTEEQLASLKGDKGDKGQDGKDYVLTETDKNEIAQIVLAEFPTAEEVSV